MIHAVTNGEQGVGDGTHIEQAILKHYQAQGTTTDEDTMSLLRRLAAHYPDDTIAGILNRQGRKTAYGERFTAHQVGSLRRYHEIPRFEPCREYPKGEAVLG